MHLGAERVKRVRKFSTPNKKVPMGVIDGAG